MWLPIAVLVLPIVAIGIVPQTVAGPIVETTARAVVGGARRRSSRRCGTVSPKRWR